MNSKNGFMSGEMAEKKMNDRKARTAIPQPGDRSGQTGMGVREPGSGKPPV